MYEHVLLSLQSCWIRHLVYVLYSLFYEPENITILFPTFLSFCLFQIAVLDVDICGPSIPKVMGLEGEQVRLFCCVTTGLRACDADRYKIQHKMKL